MNKKKLVSADWEPCTEYINGDLLAQRLRSGRRVLKVYWNKALHDCGLAPTKKNVEAMSNLFASMKGKP